MGDDFDVKMKFESEPTNFQKNLEQIYRDYKGKLFRVKSIKYEIYEQKSEKFVQQEENLKLDSIKSGYFNNNLVGLRIYFQEEQYPFKERAFEQRVRFFEQIWLMFKNQKGYYPKKPKYTMFGIDSVYLNLTIVDYQEIKKFLLDLIDFSFALMKNTGQDHFIGGWEIYTEEPTEHNIELICAKKDKIYQFLAAHIQHKFSLNLTTEEIKKIVKQTAEFTQQREDFIIISLFPTKKEIQEKGTTRFYEAIKSQTTKKRGG